jgi:hypothetical protein
MLNIAEELKTIYKDDTVPQVSKNTPKELEIFFPGLDLTIYTDRIVDDSFSLDESLFSDADIRFGACEASQIKFTLADVPEDLNDHEFIINQIVGEFTVPLGKYKVNSAKKQDDLRFKEIIAYNKLKDSDVDVAAWFNSLSFPMTLAAFRASLLNHLGIEEELRTLPNDDMMVQKTIEPSQISGRVVLEACEEINGCFGHINRLGKLAHVILEPSYGLYPAATLYPSDDLFPVSESDMTYLQEGSEAAKLERYNSSVRFEEYTVKEIDKLQIRQEEDDIGCIVGDGSNAYVIEGNFLVFGKSAAELETIAINAFGNMRKRPYRPYESENIGLSYIEVGDTIAYATDDVVAGYVFKRSLTGIQALKDKFTANGSEKREHNFGVNKQLIQLQGKYTLIKKTVEGIETTVGDMVDDVYTQISQLSDAIELKVDASGVISAINLSPGSVKISADKIDLNGYATFTALATSGATEIHGGNLKTGTVVADSVRANWVYAGNINANQITSGTINGDRIYGGTIQGVVLKSVGALGRLEIDGAYIQAWNSSGTLKLNIDSNGNIDCGNVKCSTLNGYTPITSNNIGSQSVSYASNSGSSGLASSAYELISQSGVRRAYISAGDNFIPGSGGMYIGSSVNYWAGAYLGSGPAVVSDENKKHDIELLSGKYISFAKKIIPVIFKYNDGTSGRTHVGFIAQQVEAAMIECGISDMEFAGLIKAPIYAEKLENGEYDTASEIVGYDRSLRYDEFIPLSFALYADLIKNSLKQ